MDISGRRGRRYRGLCQVNVPLVNRTFRPPCGKPWNFVDGFCNIFIMSSLIALIYLILEYHCSTCKAQYNLNNISKNIYNIAKNLSYINNSYFDLETKITQLSQDLPKIQDQVEILEALVYTINNQTFVWNPKKPLNLQNFDINLNHLSQAEMTNITQSYLNNLHEETEKED